MTSKPLSRLSQREFIALFALMMSMAALSVDAMLPSLADIGRDLNVAHPNQQQFVIVALFLGLSIGQIFCGPISDHIGRKPAIYIANTIFVFGYLLSIFSTTFEMMIAGRVLQGIGISGPRIVCLAIIRDQFEGRQMARIMSYILTVFVLVPILAPTLGQFIAWATHWRGVFVFILLLGITTWIWFARRQPETLTEDKRIPLSWSSLRNGIKETLTTPVSLGYSVLNGLILGAFISFIASSQQIFSDIFGITSLFPIYFSGLAFFMGIATFMNGRIVVELGMKRLCAYAITGLILISAGFTLYALPHDGTPPLWPSMFYFMTIFLFIGILFSNTNSLALEPLGHIAGLASSIVGSVSTFLSVIISSAVGQMFNATVLPLTITFTALGTLAMIIMWLVERKNNQEVYCEDGSGGGT